MLVLREELALHLRCRAVEVRVRSGLPEVLVPWGRGADKPTGRRRLSVCRNEGLVGLEETVCVGGSWRCHTPISPDVLRVWPSPSVVGRQLSKLLLQGRCGKLVEVWQVIVRVLLLRRRKLRARRGHSVTIGVNLRNLLRRVVCRLPRRLHRFVLFGVLILMEGTGRLF